MDASWRNKEGAIIEPRQSLRGGYAIESQMDDPRDFATKFNAVPSLASELEVRFRMIFSDLV